MEKKKEEKLAGNKQEEKSAAERIIDSRKWLKPEEPDLPDAKRRRDM